MTPADHDLISVNVLLAARYRYMTATRKMNAARMALGWGSKPLYFAGLDDGYRAWPGQWSVWLHLPGDFVMERN